MGVRSFTFNRHLPLAYVTAKCEYGGGRNVKTSWWGRRESNLRPQPVNPIRYAEREDDGRRYTV